MKSGIYEILSKVDGKRYVGSSVRSLSKRESCHFNDLRRNAHNNHYLQNIYNKYGESNLVFFIIEYCKPSKCIEREQYWIDTIKPEINLCPSAGNLNGFRWNQKSKENKSYQTKEYFKLKENRQKTAETTKKAMVNPKIREKCRLAKLGKPGKNKKEIICIGNNKIYGSAREAAKDLGVLATSICNNLKGRSNKTSGLVFRYIKDSTI